MMSFSLPSARRASIAAEFPRPAAPRLTALGAQGEGVDALAYLEETSAASIGLGRIVTLHDRTSTSYQIC